MKKQRKKKGKVMEQEFIFRSEENKNASEYSITKVVHEEVFFTPDEAFEATRARLSNISQQKKFHKDSESFDPSKFTRKYAKQIRLKDLTDYFKDKVQIQPYFLPESLYNKVEKMVQTEYFAEWQSTDKRKNRAYQTKLDQALYFCIAVLYFNAEKTWLIKEKEYEYKNKKKAVPKSVLNRIQYECDVTKGCELAKSALTHIIPNKDLYIVKEMLARYKIIRKCSII
jgi:hypothetical protein